MTRAKSGIALLITLLFVIVITVAIGTGMRQVNIASTEVKKENFTYQSSLVLEDVLKILKSAPELKEVADGNTSELYLFLLGAEYIPFSTAGIDIVVHVESARGKMNPKLLAKTEVAEIVREHLTYKNINSEYVTILIDSISGVKEDNSYASAIFNENPYLFRDYIASKEQLKMINRYYAQEYNENSLKNVDFEELFYFSDANVSDSNATTTNYKIDVNYASQELWELLAGVSSERAEILSEGAGSYESREDLDLSDTEWERVEKFNISFYEPYLYVDVEIRKEESRAKISFEYDIKKNKGSNFVFKI